MNISKAAALYEVTPATLRYYEQQGLIPPVKRKKSGIRDYSVEDLNWIEFVKCMRNSGLSIGALSKYMTLYSKGDSSLEARKDILVDEYEKLVEKQRQLTETVARLNDKIKNYEVKIHQSTKNGSGEELFNRQIEGVK
ncbi:hypothetical protein RV11_GL002756 [Enterococcus phoeniculicola]|jgi:DNA-binding transcriptional MerR regulator|uniref:HTH merR-type domain-containing protein n=1 Tax=Enterococcus phoeniculicola ATCC BAA-412 TaxID=1158610 RepID=R3W223_9ENTE|nr:MerR family transcriptional regulator [Enterococcus phoeniculicola]EOL41722.1 hypothetical protein UC3_03287 [Enterococcus phoeniculicola ATCC BAA-412]EOT78784.1 hypothetical protein I589_00289 [Enterococcus phoeniculicola ATCC BAA-412]OJG72617.1 hypothetical protein RV11_GL002756 [Enterococcus phoeniculicola]